MQLISFKRSLVVPVERGRRTIPVRRGVVYVMHDVEGGSTLAEALGARGHEVVDPGAVMGDRFGGGQAITRLPDGTLVGGSDRRKDGCALGLDA